MRFSIRQLMIATFLVSACLAGPVLWHRWYNHEIADFSVGDKHRICFRSKYEGWRGPRRVLDVKIYEDGAEILDLSCRVRNYWNTKPAPKMYHTEDRNFVCVTYPGARNYILGDISCGEFGTKYRGTGAYLITTGHGNELTPQWEFVLGKVKADNPNMIVG